MIEVVRSQNSLHTRNSVDQNENNTREIVLVGVGQFVQGARAQPIDSRSPESGLLSSWIANNMHHTYSLQAENTTWIINTIYRIKKY